uniref:Uncharacterized protein n=1 Tax=Thermofilum pendens TaxID=2269 RepID=A0A7C4B9H9_THEPE
MASPLRLTLSVIALLLLLSAGSALALRPGNARVDLPAVGNQTQAVLNSTLYIKTCKGEDIIWQGSEYPLVTISNESFNYTKKITCTKFSCTVEYPLPGNYTLDAEWLGRKVFSQTLYLNGSQQTITVKADISNVLISVYTLDGRELQGLKVVLRVGRYEVEALSGQKIALPHGQVGYEVSSPSGLAKASGVSEISCGSPVLRVVLNVFNRLVFVFKLLDDLPATGLNGSVKILYDNTELKSIDLRSSSEVEISEAPTGKYRVIVFIAGKRFEEKTIDVATTSNTYVIQLSIVSSIPVRLLDTSGNVVQDENLEATVVDPLGRVYKGNLSGGLLVLQHAPLGNYELIIRNVKWGLQLGSYAFSASSVGVSRGVDVPTNLARSVAEVRASGSQALPRDSYILFKYAGVVVLAERLSEERTSIIIELGYLPIGATLQLTFSYGSYTEEKVLSVAKREILVEIQLYDVKLSIIDLDKKPVKGCNINIVSKYFNYSLKLDGNDIYLKNIPLTDIKISVACSGVEVLRTVLTPEELKRKNATLVAHIGDIHVYVKSWFDRPIPGASVKVTVTTPSGRAEYLAYTDQSGFAPVRDVALPPTANATLEVSFKGITYERRLDVNSRYYNVFLDVLIDTPIFVLSLSQTIAIIVISLALIAAAFLVYTRIARIRTLRELFEEPLGEVEEHKERGLLARLRRFFSKKEKEGEEEQFFSI